MDSDSFVLCKSNCCKRVTENKGKRTPGVDGVCWISNEDKFNAIFTLQRRGYQPQPLRRIYIPKEKWKKETTEYSYNER